MSLASVAGSAATFPEPPVVVVESTGTWPTVADGAVVALGAVAEDEEAGAALAASSERLARLVHSLHAAGAVADLAARAIELRRRDQGGPEQASGYRATSWISAVVRPPDDLGAVLSDVLGADPELVVGHVGLVSGDASAARAQARQQAVAEARRAARQLAEAAGIDLGPIISLVEASEPLSSQDGGRAPARPAIALARQGAAARRQLGASEPQELPGPGEPRRFEERVTVVATFQLVPRPGGSTRRA